MRVILQRAAQSPWLTDPARWCFGLGLVGEHTVVVAVVVEVVLAGVVAVVVVVCVVMFGEQPV